MVAEVGWEWRVWVFHRQGWECQAGLALSRCERDLTESQGCGTEGRNERRQEDQRGRACHTSELLRRGDT